MREAVALALDHGVAIGAHPSFPDREHFGRREMRLNARRASRVHRCADRIAGRASLRPRAPGFGT